MLLAGCAEEPPPDATAQAEVETTPEDAAPTPAVPYRLTIEGVEDAALRALLNRGVGDAATDRSAAAQPDQVAPARRG